MSQRYILYIDVLGFSEMVKSSPSKIGELYKIIDSLNVHRHDVFKTIVFSDTILVYNDTEPKSGHDHAYLVRYSCEFAQDLVYRTIKTNVHFRAVLRYGEFDHYHLQHIECFFGTGLIDAYLKEKEIACTGLFIDKSCERYNLIFPISKYDDDVSFVYLNQSLERLNLISQGMLPVDPYYLNYADEFPWLVWEVMYLKNIHDLMINHREPKVRAKFLMAWQFYRLRYPDLLHEFQQSNFSLKVICPSYDWAQKLEQYDEKE